jgi:lipoyl-dependent peroxiredoxin
MDRMLASCMRHTDDGEDEMARLASAEWRGNLQEGEGTMALGSGAWEGPFTFKSRFEEGAGSNPEELIGAAEAGCFTMQLSHDLSEAGHVPDLVHTDARVTIRNLDGAPTITKIALSTRARVAGIDAETLQRTAEATREACIISRALGSVAEITVETTLES